MAGNGARSIDNVVRDCASWPDRLGDREWSVYRRVIAEAQQRAIPFAIGGGLAAMSYAGRWRDTKDIDFYVTPQHKDEMISVALGCGMRDYYEREPYDRKWIFRTYTDDIIVDVMWAMANQRAPVDLGWFHGPTITAGGLSFGLLGLEEEIWSKLYVLQRDRCDWPDVFNMLAHGPDLDWHRLITRVGPDKRLFAGLLAAFSWLCPSAAARRVPDWLWTDLVLTIPPPELDPRVTEERARLLDSRPWFGSAGETFEVTEET
jgi:hypothetical protein